MVVTRTLSNSAGTSPVVTPGEGSTFLILRLATVTGIAASLAACGGGPPIPVAADPASGPGREVIRVVRGDASRMPSWGGWSIDPVPAEAAARAGFDWFETGYPGDAHTNHLVELAFQGIGVAVAFIGWLAARALYKDAKSTVPARKSQPSCRERSVRSAA